MKLSVSTMTANRRFVKALRRQQDVIEELKRRFEGVDVETCPHEILLIAFVDQEGEFFRVVPGDPDIFEVEVGYDTQGEYPPDDDALVVQMLEGKITRMIDACDALGEARKSLNAVVERWATEVIAP